MSGTPYLFLDVDGILHGQDLKYGHERTVAIRERILTELVHPKLRPATRHAHAQQFGGELPDWLAARRTEPKHVSFTSRLRISPLLLNDIAALGVDVMMLTTWLEHDSVDRFFEQAGGAPFPYTKLRFPGRDFDDPQAAVPERWKVDELIRVIDADPRPFLWADDDEVPQWRNEIESRYPDIPKLLLAPLYDTGITREHMAEMQKFAAAHGPA